MDATTPTPRFAVHQAKRDRDVDRQVQQREEQRHKVENPHLVVSEIQGKCHYSQTCGGCCDLTDCKIFASLAFKLNVSLYMSRDTIDEMMLYTELSAHGRRHEGGKHPNQAQW